jgi:hypothetical protein
MKDSYDFIETEDEQDRGKAVTPDIEEELSIAEEIIKEKESNSSNNTIQHNSKGDESKAVDSDANTGNPPQSPTVVERIVLIVADVIRRL